MKRFKKLLAIILAVCVLVSVVSCIGEKKSVFRQTEPIRELTCIELSDSPSLYRLADGNILASVYMFEEGTPSLYVSVIDPIADKLIAEKKLDGNKTEISPIVLENGGVAIYNHNTNEYTVFDGKLEPLKEFTAPEQGCLSPDGEKFYYCDNTVLYEMDVDSGESVIAELDRDMRFYSIDAYENSDEYAFGNVYLSDDGDLCSCTVDLKNKKFVTLSEDYYGLYYSKHYYYYGLVSKGDYGNSDMVLVRNGDALGKKFDLSRLDDDQIYNYITDSPYLTAVCYDYDTAQTGEQEYDPGLLVSYSGLVRIGDDIEAADFKGYGITETLGGTVYLDEYDLLISSVREGNEIKFISIAPYLLEYETVGKTEPIEPMNFIDDQIVFDWAGRNDPEYLSERYNGVREFADSLEKKYGVEISISDECKGKLDGTDYTATLTSEMKWSSECAKIERALEVIDETFALFPDGFFDQFKNAKGEGGLQLYLVGRLVGEINAAGLQWSNDFWHFIAFTTDDISKNTISHELWHAIENEIGRHVINPFYNEDWDALNPDGFNYLYQREDYGNYDNEWIYRGVPSDDAYFIDSYSCTDPREDRARIMEYMTIFDFQAEDLVKCPKIQKKYEFMLDILFDTFDTVGWQDDIWHKNLPKE